MKRYVLDSELSLHVFAGDDYIQRVLLVLGEVQLFPNSVQLQSASTLDSLYSKKALDPTITAEFDWGLLIGYKEFTIIENTPASPLISVQYPTKHSDGTVSLGNLVLLSEEQADKHYPIHIQVQPDPTDNIVDYFRSLYPKPDFDVSRYAMDAD